MSASDAGKDDAVFVRGMILKSYPAGETDKRVVILTLEQGKITAFASGVRRMQSPLLAALDPFCFGTYTLRPTRSAYRIVQAKIETHFEALREDANGACYGMYFLELADYYTRENNEDRELLKLLYQSLRALSSDKPDNRLVRRIFEIRALFIEGEYPGAPLRERTYDESTLYALSFITTQPIERLYTFTVSDRVMEELSEIADDFRKRFIDREMKSLPVLASLETIA